MPDYIDPWVGLWVAIFLWGLWLYIIVKEAKRARVKVSVEEDVSTKKVKVWKMTKGEWVLLGDAILERDQSVSDYVKKVVNRV